MPIKNWEVWKMKIRGNYLLFFALEFVSGVLVYILTMLYGDIGLLGMILFFLALILTQKVPDEREMMIIYKVSALEAAFLGAVMAIIYLKFLDYNWFHGFISFALMVRGVLGTLHFLKS